MKRIFSAVLSLMVISIPVVASAKGDLVRIEVAGTTLSSTRVIADAEILRKIHIWSGPGTGQPPGSSLGTDSGFIDWQAGIVERVPANMISFDVSFFCVLKRAEPAGRLTYAVKYAYDPTARRGYFYLPGPREKHYSLNVSTIVHDVEGRWFKASPHWESHVAPRFREEAAPGSRAAAAK
jgi:hypothetical protein